MIVAALAVVAASCGGGDAADTTTTTAPTTTSSTTTTAQATTTVPQSTTTTTADSGLTATATTQVVQADLTFLGYFEGTIDGIAGEETEAALSAFQTDEEIEVDGEYGPQTDVAMAARLESDEEYVTDLQEFLIEQKLYPGPTDGDYGDGTKKAVEAFQEDCEIEVTGSLDIDTRLCRAAAEAA